MNISAILLAAGESKRFGTNKLAHLYKGKTLLEHALCALSHSCFISEIIIVVNDKLANCRLSTVDCQPKILINKDYKQGMGTSLREGVKACRDSADAYLVALADMPLVKTQTVEMLIAEFEKNKKSIVIPVCENRKGHPVILPSYLKAELLALGQDKGARDVIQKYAEHILYVPVSDKGILFDVDERKDIEHV